MYAKSHNIWINNEQDELEYNDGLGDLLKERDQLQFSWGKTATVLVAILAVTFALFWGFFKTNSTSEKVEFHLNNDEETILDECLENLL